jgi:hypothetical protein
MLFLFKKYVEPIGSSTLISDYPRVLFRRGKIEFLNEAMTTADWGPVKVAELYWIKSLFRIIIFYIKKKKCLATFDFKSRHTGKKKKNSRIIILKVVEFKTRTLTITTLGPINWAKNFSKLHCHLIERIFVLFCQMIRFPLNGATVPL